ncbi:MAG: rhodanese-like domain-containing protein [Acidobacteriota bacterium]|nr:rhodanese-like domain-containing protein [Acidobacteriota bacterium]
METTGRSDDAWRPAVKRAFSVLLPGLLAALLAASTGCRTIVAWRTRSVARRPPYRTVSPPVAYEILRDNPGVLVLDLRSPQDYMGPSGHLRRSVNIPLARLPYRLLEISSFRGETFLAYCDTDSCGTDGMAVLASSGFQDGILIDGGIDRWIEAGFHTYLPATDVRHTERRHSLSLIPNPPAELPVAHPALSKAPGARPPDWKTAVPAPPPPAPPL